MYEGRGRTATFAELWRAARGFARFLQRDVGIEPGETVAISSQGSRDFAVAMYGSWMAGAAVSPVNPLLQQREVEAQLLDSEARALVASSPTRDALAGSTFLQRIAQQKRVLLEEAWAIGVESDPELTSLPWDGGDVIFLPYTSGTEGLPKGAMLTHAHLLASAAQLERVGRISNGSVVLDFAPMWAAVRLTISVGATCVENLGLDESETLQLVERLGVTNILGRPFSLQRLLTACDGHEGNLSCVRYVETTGAALPAPAANRARYVFKCQISQGYHLTETAGSGNRCPLDRDIPEAVGPPVAGVEERIVDPETGLDVPSGEVGELVMRGPQVMAGYWHNPEATARAFLRGRWLRTGDLARQNEEGFVYIVDRLKDIIKTYGRQVAPTEVEAALLGHPAVQDAAVEPFPSIEAGELVKALVVLKPGATASAIDLQAHIGMQLAQYKVPREIEVVASIPRGPGGKVTRRHLSNAPERDTLLRNSDPG